MLLEFKIVDKELFNISKKTVIKEDKKNKCNFYFDEETYKGKELFVTFINKFGYSRTIVLGRWKKTLSCNIPLQMLDFDYFKIFCYTKSLYKTNTLKVYNKLVLNDLEALINKMDRKIDNILYEDGELKCYANNILVNSITIGDIDEEMIGNIIERKLSGFQEMIDERLEDYINEEDLDYLILTL